MMNLRDLFRSFNTERRQQLAKEGKALPDGSYPIVTVGDLKNAVRAFGRGGNKAQVKRHIIKRARALGHMELLPADWDASTKEEANVAEDVSQEVTNMAETVDTPETVQAETEVVVTEQATDKTEAELMAAKMASLEQENEQLKAKMVADKLEARKAELKQKAESFKALSLKPDEFVEKFSALQDKDAALAAWVIERFEAIDSQMVEAGLLREIGTAGEGTTDPKAQFLALVDRIHNERYEGKREKYSSALAAASKEYPELAQHYAEA